jgi:transposase
MTDVTSPCPVEVSPEVLSDPAVVLFGLEHDFAVLQVERMSVDSIKVVVELTAREGPCPACGVLTSAVKERPLGRLKDLPAAGQRVELWWRKRRLACRETLCPRRSFTQTCTAVRPRGRVTERLRDRMATAIATSNRAVADVAAEYGVSWPTAHQALIAAAARWLPAPTPTRVLGIDETRFRTVRWILDGISWKRSDPWLTSFVDCSIEGPGSLLGLAPGRTGGCVKEWLAEQTEQFRHQIDTVVIDPSAPYASGIRASLPNAVIAVDKWHLVALAHTMVTEVRQRVTREHLGRRGTTADPVWVNRRMLLTGAEHLSDKQWRRLWAGFDQHMTPPRRSRPRGRSRSGSGCCSRSVSRRRSAGRWPTSTRPSPMPTCPKRPDSPARSNGGGPPSWSRSELASRMPGPRGSTGSSSRPNGSAAASGT